MPPNMPPNNMRPPMNNNNGPPPMNAMQMNMQMPQQPGYGGQQYPPQQQQMQQQPPQMSQQMSQQQQYPSQIPQQQMTATTTTATATNAVDPAADPTKWQTATAPGTNLTYYYNTVTQATTYDRPACLGPDAGATNATATTNASAEAAASAIVAGVVGGGATATKWTKYADAASGKSYYHDGATGATTWDRPADYVSDDDGDGDNDNDDGNDVGNASNAKRRSSGTADGSAGSKKRQRTDNGDGEVAWSTKAEATAAFKGLLLAKGITPTSKWNDVVRQCSSDHRWDACSTDGQRKQALSEYQVKRSNDLKEEKRKERQRAKTAFQDMLSEVVPSIWSASSSSSSSQGPTFDTVRDKLAKDDRFYAVDEETAREDLFYEFCDDLRKRDERRKKNARRDAKAAFLAFLKDKEEAQKVSVSSTWDGFVSSLTDDDKTDSRYSLSEHMADSERQLYFADFILDLQDAEEERRQRIYEARRKAEKSQREEYREALRKLAVAGKIIPSTRWRNIEDVVCEESSYGPVEEQGQEVPREIFEDFVDDWNDDYKSDRSRLRVYWRKAKSKIKLSAETQYEDFTKVLLDAVAESSDSYSTARRIVNREEPVSSAKLYFDELLLEAKEGPSRSRRGRKDDDSSEDEGEIIEDGEIEDGEEVE